MSKCVSCGREEQYLRVILITCAVSTETKHSCKKKKKKSAQEKFYTVSPERKNISSCVFLVWFILHLLAKFISKKVLIKQVLI